MLKPGTRKTLAGVLANLQKTIVGLGEVVETREVEVGKVNVTIDTLETRRDTLADEGEKAERIRVKLVELLS